jgi:uncharacterized membrane protein YdjX (TVP38/TMEM64 family)
MVAEALSWVANSGLLALAALAVASGLFFVPRPVLCLLGGAAFGFWAVPAIVIGTTAGAAAAFLLSRHVVRARFTSAVARRPSLGAYLHSIETDGWTVVFLLRLGSPIPGLALNYSAGLTGIPLRVFSGATFAGIIPHVVALVWLGALGRAVLDAPEVRLLQAAFLGVGLITTVLAGSMVARRAGALVVSRQS